MIEVIKQDRFEGEILDTTIKINTMVTVEGMMFEEFQEKLTELISQYRI